MLPALESIMRSMKERKNVYKIIIFIVTVLALFAAGHMFGLSDYLSDVDNLVSIGVYVEENMAAALAVYMVLTVIGCVLLALPGVTFAVAAGMIFGPATGSAACLAATTLGAMASFLAGRYFLKDGIKPKFEKNKTLKKLLFSDDDKNEIILLMITRMVPIFPYNLQNFAYGITDIGFWKYSVFTFVFMTPGVLFFTTAAAGITASGDKWIYFGASCVFAAIVTLAVIFIKKKYIK